MDATFSLWALIPVLLLVWGMAFGFWWGMTRDWASTARFLSHRTRAEELVDLFSSVIDGGEQKTLFLEGFTITVTRLSSSLSVSVAGLEVQMEYQIPTGQPQSLRGLWYVAADIVTHAQSPGEVSVPLTGRR